MAEKIPFEVSDYIKQRFRDEFLFEVRKTTDSNGKVHYHADVDQDGYAHHLIFNERGKLIHEQVAPAFAEGDRDDTANDPGFDTEDLKSY